MNLLLMALFLAAVSPQANSFTVTIDPPVHGKLEVNPPLPADGKYPAGTVITLKTTPDAGYVQDSAWYSVPGQFGQMYHEGIGREFKVTIDRDKRIGVSFIEQTAVSHINVTNDVVYAKPGVKPLKYDVYSPKGARNLPCIVIIHGGGWNANDEDIMRGLARELTKGGRFVVFSIDYRWAGKADGDENANTMANLIEDVFGAIAHIMEHAKEYGGDPTRIGLTGDSAGGHLSAAASLMTNMIGAGGFMPSYLPKDKSVDQVRAEMMSAIKAAAPSYGVFGGMPLEEAVAPLSHIPKASERSVPQYLTRGTSDRLISNASVTEFVDALAKAGQRVEYVQIDGANHAFFDWKPDARTKATFAQYGVYYAAEMKAFFVSVLY